MMIPDFFKEGLVKQYGESLGYDIIDSYHHERKTTFRVNTLKTTVNEIKDILCKESILFHPVLWSDFSFVLDNVKEDSIKKLNIYKEGKIYLQSLSSQLPPFILAPKGDEIILDMTAAPGGKTTQMAALSHNQAMITAVEINKKRCERLKYNIEHMNAKRVTVLQSDARHLDSSFLFDKILLDAPCSGSGTLDEKTVALFQEEFIYRCVSIQKELIKEAVKHLPVGGELVYSTCSILKEENEDVIQFILDAGEVQLIPLYEKDYEDIPFLPVTMKGTLCVKPTEEYEGFFVAKLKKIKIDDK